MVRFERYSGKDAGAAELEETLAGVAGDKIGQLEFALGIEAAGRCRDFLPQQAVGANNAAMLGTGQRGVEDEQMITKRIEMVGVAAVLHLEQVLPGAKLVIEHPVAHFLRGGDLGLVAGKPHFEVADTAERFAFCDGIDVPPGEQSTAGVRPSVTFRHNCMHE